MMPKVSPAVDVCARTFNCVVVVPSMGDMEGIGVGGEWVCVACGIGEGGNVAVTNSGTAVTVLSLAMFTLQLVHMSEMAKRKETVLEFTSLLYPRIKLHVTTQTGRNQKTAGGGGLS
jgi:hypothetical protein